MAYTCQHFHTSTRALRIDEEKLCCDWLTATSCVVQVTMGYNKNVAPYVAQARAFEFKYDHVFGPAAGQKQVGGTVDHSTGKTLGL